MSDTGPTVRPRVEFWRPLLPRTVSESAAMAAGSEAAGWYGVTFGDSQNALYDAFVSMTLAATATSRIGLGTGVANSVTRHPALMASGFASLQQLSAGRVVLGIGRGDSAIHFLNKTQPSPAEFECYVSQLQQYLRGDAVDLDGFASQIDWLQPDDARLVGPRKVLAGSPIPKVPVDVAATGPRMIAAGARQAERITLSVGADPDRVRASIELARTARSAAGLDPDGLRIGLYLVGAVDEDLGRARDELRGMVALHARFSAIGGRPVAGVAARDATAMTAIVSARDVLYHGLSEGPQARAADDGFVDRFAVVGPPARCIDQLGELCALGITHINMNCHSGKTAHDTAERYYTRFINEVIPALG